MPHIAHIADAILAFIQNDLLEPGDGIALTGDTRLVTGEVLDSMALLELVGFVEDEFDVVVEPAEVSIDNFETVERIAALVAAKLPPEG